VKHQYPRRLSVAELRQEFEAYLEYRRTGGADRKVAEPTITADRTHIGQFLDWLETGRAGRLDIDELIRREYPD
jgi:hypothetical protein